jgi:Chaperone of endosialidase
VITRSFANTTGRSNTATGASALTRNTTGDFNTANGSAALFSNTTGDNNTADGSDALSSNTTGLDNTAMGYQALFSNTTGDSNTAVGTRALFSNVGGVLFSGGGNTAIGSLALEDNTTGFFNTAIGGGALLSNTTGDFNIALGVQAGDSLTTGDSNIDIGNRGVAGESNTIRIGTQGTHTATYIAGVSGAAVMGAAVKVSAAGQIGAAPSSVRFKRNVKTMGDISDALFALRPVTFRYKREIDPQGMQQFGLVAEEVEKVNPDLVVRDRDGKPYTVRYEAVDAMLLNEFLEEHEIVQAQSCKFHELEWTITELRSAIAQQEKQIQALASSFEKVSAEIQLSRPAQHAVVAENP